MQSANSFHRGRTLDARFRRAERLAHLRRGLRSAALAVSALFALGACNGVAANDLMIMGWIENAELEDTGLRLRAKLDTGARSSSLDVLEHEIFKKDGRDWVRFTVSDRKKTKKVLERPVLKFIRIKRSEAVTTRRPVIEMRICVGPIAAMTQVNLANRAHLNNPLLIGRRFLENRILVDSGRTFLTKRLTCGKESK